MNQKIDREYYLPPPGGQRETSVKHGAKPARCKPPAPLFFNNAA